MDYQYWTGIFLSILSGTKTATALFALVIVLSLPLGFLFTLMTRSKIAPVRWFAHFYIYVLRSTPLLLQLLFIYFGLPFLPVVGPYLTMQRFPAAILGFTLNYAAYFAEIFRGGMLAVDQGQYEASQVLGLSKFQTLVHIIIPQMIRVALPSITNESITLVKDTSLLYAVSVPEILHYTKAIVNRDSNVSVFIVAALIYLAMNLVLTLFFRWLEKKMSY